MRTFRVYWQEKDGSYNESLLETASCAVAACYIESDERCNYVWKVEEVETK